MIKKGKLVECYNCMVFTKKEKIGYNNLYILRMEVHMRFKIFVGIFILTMCMCVGCGKSAAETTMEEASVMHGEGQVVGADKDFLIKTQTEQTESESEKEEEVQDDVLKSGSRMGNILNSGIVCEKDEWTYFGKKNNANRLYRRNDYGEIQQVGEIAGAINLNVLSDRIIYQSGGIWEYSFETNSARQIVEGSCRNVIVEDEKIFYLKEDGEIYKIYSADLDGGNETNLSPNVASFLNVVEDRIYYIAGGDEGRIHQMKLDGSDDRTISSFGGVEELLVDNGIAYYVSSSASGYELWSITVGGENDHKIYGNECHNINVWDHTIYFRNQTDMQLCSIRDDGTGLESIVDGQCISINLTRDWIYYFNVDDMNYYRIRKDGTDAGLVE